MDKETIPTGMSAIFVSDGDVIAHVTDFARDRYGGFTLQESQEHRVKDRLARAVVKALSSPLLADNMDNYTCQRILEKIPGKVHIMPIGGAHSATGDERG